MREIKFRCWNKKKKFMDSAWLLDFEHARVCHAYHNESNMDDCEIMQFTGLRDKNGKEIYEGDILRRPGYAEGLSDYIVGFERGHFTLQHTKTAYNQLGIWNIADTTEVVGNIHENPELLTKEETK